MICVKGMPYRFILDIRVKLEIVSRIIVWQDPNPIIPHILLALIVENVILLLIVSLAFPNHRLIAPLAHQYFLGFILYLNYL